MDAPVNVSQMSQGWSCQSSWSSIMFFTNVFFSMMFFHDVFHKYLKDVLANLPDLPWCFSQMFFFPWCFCECFFSQMFFTYISRMFLPVFLIFHDVFLVLLLLTPNCCRHVSRRCLGSNNLNSINGPASSQGTASQEGGELCADADRWGGQYKVEDHLLPGRSVFHQPGERLNKVEEHAAERSLNDNEDEASGDLPDASHNADRGDGQASRDSKCHRNKAGSHTYCLYSNLEPPGNPVCRRWGAREK